MGLHLRKDMSAVVIAIYKVIHYKWEIQELEISTKADMFGSLLNKFTKFTIRGLLSRIIQFVYKVVFSIGHYIHDWDNFKS